MNLTAEVLSSYLIKAQSIPWPWLVIDWGDDWGDYLFVPVN